MKRFIKFLLGALLIAGGAFAASNPAAVLTVTNIAALRALGAAAPQYPNVQVSGYYTAGDGGGGLFRWMPASTATAEPCMTFAASGVATGRYRLQPSNNVLSVLQCGVKADSSTDNSTAMQAAFDAVPVYSLSEVYCPATAGTIKFGTSLIPNSGMIFRGQANNWNGVVGSTSLVPGTCQLVYTGSSWAIDWQTPFQSVVACPSVPAPRFYNFVLSRTGSGGGSIRFNNSVTAGFTDDCVGAGGGQSQVFGGTFDGVFIYGNGPDTGIQLNKAFDTTITNSVFYNNAIQIDAEGSDNLLITNNKFAFAYTRSVDLQARGTFGNFNTLRDNTFFSELENASEFVRDSARSGIIDGNYFETDFPGMTSVINVNGCNLSQTITNNAMELIPAYVTYWLSVSGNCISIVLNNNYDGGGGAVPAIWNSGLGSHPYGGSSKQIISATNNPDANASIPFITRQNVPPSGGNAPAISGSILGTYDASAPLAVGGNYSSAIYIGAAGHSGDFGFAPIAATGGHITFQFAPVVTATIDLWILAYNSTAATDQVLTVTDGVSTGTVTITGGATPTWYKALSNDAVTNPTIDTYNNDTGHGHTVYVSRWQAVKH